MHSTFNYDIVPLGDAALLVSFGNTVDLNVNRQVQELFLRLNTLQLPYIRDLVPAYSSLAVHYDVYLLHTNQKINSAYNFMVDVVNKNTGYAGPDTALHKPRQVLVPVCYSPPYAPDLAAIAAQKKLTEAEVIRLHTTLIYTIYMIGFLPGFPYMGKVDRRIAIPRKAIPRSLVEAGSVGIAGEQTGIYPLPSPGGWQIIGRTPLTLFQKENKDPILLIPGDQVQFYSITAHEFENS